MVEKVDLGCPINEDTSEKIPASTIAGGSFDGAGQTEVELATISPTENKAEDSRGDAATMKESSDADEVNAEVTSAWTGDQGYA